MRTKTVILLLCLLLLAPLAAADLYISDPRVSQNKTKKVEIGASPEITISYKNSTGRDVEIASLDIILAYNPNIIDHIIGIINKNSKNLLVRDQETYIPGRLRYKLSLSTAKPNPLKVRQGQTIDLATIIFHVNQETRAGRYVKLVNWSKKNPSKILSAKPYDLTGPLVDPPTSYLEGSSPPEFSGLSLVVSANTLGETNPGNTVVLDWRTPAGAFDRTKFYDGKLSFRVFRETENTNWQEISGKQPNHDPNTDPIDRYSYTGNTNTEYLFEDTGLNDGQSYLYKVTALDDTSPRPNEQRNTAVLRGVPLDLTPPREVTDLVASVGNNQITLKWNNPKDADLGGVVIMVNENKPVADGQLGQASTTGDGPEYQPGAEPFGRGSGQIIYISPQAGSPQTVPSQFTDPYATNGVLTYYKIFTYDRAVAGPPREFGRNYSKGAGISETAGIAPRPITNFRAEKGEYPGEILLLWNNSPDDFTGGTMVRFTTDDSLRYTALKNETSGQLLEAFPIYGAPGELDGYYVTGLAPEKTYYFKAFPYNATAEELDPRDKESLSRHQFGVGQTAQIYLPKWEGAAAAAPGAGAGAPDQEPAPEIKVWIGNRVYRQALVDKGIKFYATGKPKIKVEASLPEPYSLDQTASSYYIVLDNARTYAFETKKIEKNRATLELTLAEELMPGSHTFTFAARSSGEKAKASSVSTTATVTVQSGPLKIVDSPVSFPSPFNPERDKQVTLQYTLSKDTNIDLIIMKGSGEIVKKIPIQAGQEGGAGQLNKVSWDGMTNKGVAAGNGLYVVIIVSRDEGRVLGKLKLTVSR